MSLTIMVTTLHSFAWRLRLRFQQLTIPPALQIEADNHTTGPNSPSSLETRDNPTIRRRDRSTAEENRPTSLRFTITIAFWIRESVPENQKASGWSQLMSILRKLVRLKWANSSQRKRRSKTMTGRRSTNSMKDEEALKKFLPCRPSIS
jgi:hypothetical protein